MIQGKESKGALLNKVILLPIVVWPLLFFSSIFLFDDPTASSLLAGSLFIAINSYPIFLYCLYRINADIYRQYGKIGHIIPLLIISAFLTVVVLQVNKSSKLNMEIESRLAEKERKRVAAGFIGNCSTYKIVKDSIFYWSNNFQIDFFVKSYDVDFQLINCHYAKDITNVYSGDNIIDEADPESFEIIDKRWQCDKNNFYHGGQVMDYVDFETFQILELNYSKDKNKVYYGRQEIEYADPNTFEVNSNTHYASDKNRRYYYGKVSYGNE